MRKYLLPFILMIFIGCSTSKIPKNDALHQVFEDYYETYLQRHPLEATGQGDYRFNDQLPIDISEEFRVEEKDFLNRFLAEAAKFEQQELSSEDKIYLDAFKFSLNNGLKSLSFEDHLIPFHQFWGLPLTMGQLGSGSGSQPFKTVKDYEDWLNRIASFSKWADQAISNFKMGIEKGTVLPEKLVQKMIPQMQDLQSTDVQKSLFWGPINTFPNDFSDEDKTRLGKLYAQAIETQINPSYRKLEEFLVKEYLPKARTSSGIGEIPKGKEWYSHLVSQWTTTSMTPEEIFEIGEKEVARIKEEMESVQKSVGFEGSLNDFFAYMKSDKKFYPFQSAEEVLAAFEDIHQKVIPNVEKLFLNKPKTAFEIRRTEAFREASASAEYNQGTADGSRPGIFYVPIPDATKFNLTSGMESLFLHEAIPGHHYQVSLQQENINLPKFLRFGWFGAYGEGWALYCESLGKELGLYTDPYQYMGALGDEMHRAIRLVVDVGIHHKGWSREKAINYMLENEPASEEYATMEIERYMAIPGQALSYKIGSLKIQELRNNYSNSLGENFSLASFHDELLKDGCLPLAVLERKMEAWAQRN